MNEDILIRLERIEGLLTELQTSREPKKYLSIDEVSKLLSVTRVTLWNWERKGILRPARIGNLKRYKANDIDKLMNHA